MRMVNASSISDLEIIDQFTYYYLPMEQLSFDKIDLATEALCGRDAALSIREIPMGSSVPARGRIVWLVSNQGLAGCVQDSVQGVLCPKRVTEVFLMDPRTKKTGEFVQLCKPDMLDPVSISFTSDQRRFYLIDHVTGRHGLAIDASLFVAALCGPDSSHVRIRNIRVIHLGEEGSLRLAVALTVAGDPSGVVPGPLWRLCGKDNISRLRACEVSVGGVVKQSGRIEVPSQGTITGRRLDVTAGIVGTVALGAFGLNVVVRKGAGAHALMCLIVVVNLLVRTLLRAYR